MTLPAFIFGSLTAVLLGALYHLWKGGGFWRILVYITFSLIGFWGGHLAAYFGNFRFWDVGPIRFGPSLLGAIIFLLLVRWLMEVRRPTD